MPAAGKVSLVFIFQLFVAFKIFHYVEALPVELASALLVSVLLFQVHQQRVFVHPFLEVVVPLELQLLLAQVANILGLNQAPGSDRRKVRLRTASDQAIAQPKM